MKEWEARLARLEAECKELRQENASLRKQLGLEPRVVPEPPQPIAEPELPSIPLPAKVDLDTDAKIQLFRSLFRGREDIYPIRWESRNGRSGYSPACDNEWITGLCEKPRIKCSDCNNRKLLTITDQTIYDHLSGRKVIGTYALLTDDTCWFLAVDFDGDHWQEDATAFMRTATQNGIPASLEISRSGDGAHVWVFFSSSVPASTARRLGSALITLTCSGERLLSLQSYDRLFPNQDSMPKGGFGNLIALPLQKAPREKGCSVFVNESLTPYPDQWAYLASVQRVSLMKAERVIQSVNMEGGVLGVKFVSIDEGTDDPWTLPPSRRLDDKPIDGPFPKAIEIVMANMAFIPKEGLPTALINKIVRSAAFQNPEFYKTQKMRRSTFGIPRIIGCAEDFSKHIALPRGRVDEAILLMETLGIDVKIRDERFKGDTIDVSFQGELRPEQTLAVREMIRHDTGVLCAPTAFGKTVAATAIIAERKVSTLILVHRTQLMDQWASRLSNFLGIDEKRIGKLGGGKRKSGGFIDIALMQSLNRKGAVDDCIANYGQIIVDECHHLSAFSFEQILKAAKARYVLGLTATPVRRDGHHPIIFMQCGPIRYRSNEKHQHRPFDHEVIPRNTGFRMSAGTDAIHEIYAFIANSQERNKQIVQDVKAAMAIGRSPLVLTERKDHLFLLAEQLKGCTEHIITLYGGMGTKQRRLEMEKLTSLPVGTTRLILATGKLIGEGFDDSQLDTLFLAMPISWRGTLQQYAGRLHRLHDGKKVVQIYDYIDENLPVLMRMFDKRMQGYRAMGYTNRQ
ncbi:type III restriction enzyme, res subunit [mine drainage metagenome]|uniref:Type III restriction enzyme, res subunit n=1 Tax=mine drainage metagenome TaxID=410659 RepID=A0A1J5QU69_9ZZZZ